MMDLAYAERYGSAELSKDKLARKITDGVGTVRQERVRKSLKARVHRLDILFHMSQTGTTSLPILADWQELLVESLYIYAVLAIDLDDTVISWNPGVKAVLGYEADEIIGKPAHIIFTEEDRAAGIPKQELCLAKEQGNANDVRWHVRADGSLFWGTGAMSALRDDEGELIGYAKVVRDSSKGKQLEESLERINADLEDKVASRTADIRRLAAELTLAEQKERQKLAKTLHDSVQQELYGLQFALTKLKSELAGRKAADTLKEAEELLSKAVELTRRVATDLRPTELDNPDVCEVLNWLAESSLEKYGLDVKVSADACRIEDDAARALVFNLVSEMLFNIVKHAGVAEAKVTLVITDELVVTVSDEGDGFDSKAISTGGTGLGLSGAENRLTLFGGTLDIDSSPGTGTRIKFTLPLTLLESS